MPQLIISLLLDSTVTPIIQIPVECVHMYTANPALILVTVEHIVDTLKNIVPQGREQNSLLILADKSIPLDLLYRNSYAFKVSLERQVVSMLYTSGGKK